MIQLNWQQHDERSPERIVADLFTTLSPQWYPVGIVGSNVYNVFTVYGKEFSTASKETLQVLNDIRIRSTRLGTIVDRDLLKLWDNFGTMVQVGKLTLQDPQLFNFDLSIQSYKSTLWFLYNAYIDSTTDKAMNFVGAAYTGVPPFRFDPVRHYRFWTLTVVEGTISEVGNDFVITDQYIPSLRSNIVSMDNEYLFIYGGDDKLIGDNGTAVAGMRYVYSKSKLGHNTILKDSIYRYSGHELFFFIDGEVAQYPNVLSSLEQSILASTLKNIRADTIPTISFSSDFVLFRPETMPDISPPLEQQDHVIDDFWTITAEGYLTFIDRR